MSVFVTFGEVMMRMCPPGFLRLQQTLPGRLDVTFAGAEANVAASLAMLQADVRFVTALPCNSMADACVAELRGLGIDTSAIERRPEGRLGIYFVECGANQRPSRVTYDRDGSTISCVSPTVFSWAKIFDNAHALHVSGITPALSESAAQATLDAVRHARQAGLQVSCDLNYRNRLWNWKPDTDRRVLAGKVMSEILPFVDILIANEADCTDVFNIRAGTSEVESGHVQVDAYPAVARKVLQRFPQLKLIATTLRESFSASHNAWGAMLFDAATDTPFFSPVEDGRYHPYQIHNIVDRVGGGDAFAAALLFALDHPDYPDLQSALDFASAASCLAHSIVGDFNFSSRTEIDALARGSRSGRVVR